MVVNGIDVTVNGLNDISEQEIVNYIDYVQAQTKEKVNSLKLSATKDGQVDIRYKLQPQKLIDARRSRCHSPRQRLFYWDDHNKERTIDHVTR